MRVTFTEGCACGYDAQELTAVQPRLHSITKATKENIMARYVDGSVWPGPNRQLDGCRRMAQTASKIWRQHGALEYREGVGDDLAVKIGMPFPKGIKTKPAETVVFAYFAYKSRDHRDKVN